MFLCVSRLVEIESSPNNRKPALAMVELTDGWYAVLAHLDEKLSEKVMEGDIKVGTKLAVSNAILKVSFVLGAVFSDCY